MSEARDRVLADLADRAGGIPFVALVRHLERVLQGSAPVGGIGPEREEVIRFRHDVNPIFHASDVIGLTVRADRDRARVEVVTGFLGIVGSVSPLANFFTEDVLRAEAQDDPALRDFYDIFHHRLIAFVYRARLRATAWAEIRVDATDRVTRRSAWLAGLSGSERSLGMTPDRWLGLARLSTRRGRTKTMLEAALALTFPRLHIDVVDFVRRDVRLSDGARSALGVRNVELGRRARLGSRLPRQSGFVRIRLGPVDGEAFRRLLPGQPDHGRVQAIMSSVSGGLLDSEMEVEMSSEADLRARLGGNRSRLGHGALVARAGHAHGARWVRVPLSDGAAGGRPVLEVVAAPASRRDPIAEAPSSSSFP